MTIKLNDIVILKKPHPSKTQKWIVVRIGTIYKLKSSINPSIFLEFTKDKLIKVIKEIESEIK